MPLDDETVESAKQTQAIRATTLARMGFQKQWNQWVLTKVQRQQEQQERILSPPQASNSAPPPPTYITEILTGIRDLKVFVGEQLDGFGQQFSQRFDTLGYQIEHLGYCVSCLESDKGESLWYHKI